MESHSLHHRPRRGHDSSRVARLAQFFLARPGQWIDGRELAAIAGAYAWRTRISDVRRQFGMPIDNRQRLEDGRTVSEYRYLPDAPRALTPTTHPPGLVTCPE